MIEQYRYRVLIVSLSEKFHNEIGSLLQNSFDVSSVDCAASAGEARRRLLERAYDFIIVNAPLRDEFGSRLCMDASLSAGTVAAITWNMIFVVEAPLLINCSVDYTGNLCPSDGSSTHRAGFDCDVERTICQIFSA